MDRLGLLTILITDYESSRYQADPVTPINAIKFRMEEKGLKQVDLAPYFGTKSRVSEVLSGKRPLTVSMIRALSVGLGISTETLIGVEPKASDLKGEIRGWLNEVVSASKETVEKQVKSYINQFGKTNYNTAFKRTLSGDSYSPSTQYSIYAWVSRVIQKSRQEKENLGVFDPSVLSKAFLKELAQLSWSEFGPLLALEFLKNHGINVVILPTLKGALIDGAALKDYDGSPIIALTLRYDRLDNFWFTLLHEVVHIWKHIDTIETFIDDLDSSSDDIAYIQQINSKKEFFAHQ